MLAPREPFARTLAEEADQREEEALVEDAEALMHTEAPHLLHALDLLLYRCMDALGGTSRSQRPSSATPDADSPTPPVETPRQPQSAASGVLGGSTRPAAAPASPLSASKIVVDHIRLDTASKGRIQGYLQVRAPPRRDWPRRRARAPEPCPLHRCTAARLCGARLWPKWTSLAPRCARESGPAFPGSCPKSRPPATTS